jgi:hypothetical protein
VKRRSKNGLPQRHRGTEAERTEEETKAGRGLMDYWITWIEAHMCFLIHVIL